MDTRIDLRKNVRIHEALASVINKMQLKDLTFEVMFFLFAKISKSHQDETTYSLNIKEFETLIGKQANLERYKASVIELRKITFEIETEEFVLIDGILSNAKFMKGKGVMLVKISSDMKPFLLDLVTNYSQPQLWSILRMPSKHAKNIYLYLYRHRPIKGAFRGIIEETTITEFKVNTGYINEITGEEQYKDFKDFKRGVLEVAKHQINALSNIKVAYYLRKWGREFYYIEWHIENKDNTEMIQMEQFATPMSIEPKIEMTYEQKVVEIGYLSTLIEELKLSEWQANQILRQTAPNHEHLDGVIERVRNGFKLAIEKGKPVPEDRKGGYTSKAILLQYGIDLNKKPDYPKAETGLDNTGSEF